MLNCLFYKYSYIFDIILISLITLSKYDPYAWRWVESKGKKEGGNINDPSRLIFVCKRESISCIKLWFCIFGKIVIIKNEIISVCICTSNKIIINCHNSCLGLKNKFYWFESLYYRRKVKKWDWRKKRVCVRFKALWHVPSPFQDLNGTHTQQQVFLLQKELVNK